MLDAGCVQAADVCGKQCLLQRCMCYALATLLQELHAQQRMQCSPRVPSFASVVLQAAAETAQQRHDALEEASQAFLSGYRVEGQASAQRKRGLSDLAGISAREPAAAGNTGSMEHLDAKTEPAKRFKA